jgi:protease I
MILMPIPKIDFDPSETSIPWKKLTDNKIEVKFATPDGKPGEGDYRILSGNGLGPAKKLLMISKSAKDYYGMMIKDKNFINPIKYEDINPDDYSGIIIPGGHAPNTKSFYESNILQDIVVSFFKKLKPVGAICHGVLLIARSIDRNTGKSIIYDYKTTSLLKRQEMLSFYLTRAWLGDYFRTYAISVEEEVKSYLCNENNFIKGNIGFLRDSEKSTSNGFAVLDRNYLSARWFGDAYHFSAEFIKLLNRNAVTVNQNSQPFGK